MKQNKTTELLRYSISNITCENDLQTTFDPLFHISSIFPGFIFYMMIFRPRFGPSRHQCGQVQDVCEEVALQDWDADTRRCGHAFGVVKGRGYIWRHTLWDNLAPFGYLLGGRFSNNKCYILPKTRKVVIFHPIITYLSLKFPSDFGLSGASPA